MNDNGDIEIVRVGSFKKDYRKIFKQEEVKYFSQLCDILRGNPGAGDVMPGTEGCCKLRQKRPGTGKSKGIRVIYYFYCGDGERKLFLLDVYAKSDKEDISAAERNGLRDFVLELIEPKEEDHGKI